MHHFKKFHENRQKMEELDNAYEDLRNKDSELNQRYREFVK